MMHCDNCPYRYVPKPRPHSIYVIVCEKCGAEMETAEPAATCAKCGTVIQVEKAK